MLRLGLSRRIRFLLAVTGALLLLVEAISAAPPASVVHHQLAVTITPDAGRIDVEDILRFPDPVSEVTFRLHGGLAPVALDPGVELTLLGEEKVGALAVEKYQIRLPSPARNIGLRYGGTIRHEIGAVVQGYGETRQETQGDISPDGVFLSGASYWYPVLPEGFVSFQLCAKLPEGWSAVSQGKDDPEVAGCWSESAPQDEIYLVAGRYTLFRRSGPVAEAQVWLLQPDQALANRYLDATERYLERYSKLIGPYPYSKFATVENFWETGYGMPSFTLLGSKVLRLPFILQSSFPHEVLHNWWGNGVYVTYERGNWSEGLTTYLADYLIKEEEGEGATYRRDTLQRYDDYVKEGEDLPLTEFRGRHGQRSQAVGYGKGMMFFHMLRKQLGEARFWAGVRRFYADNLFRAAGYAELQKAFEAVSGGSLEGQFAQWVRRSGAPRLELGEVRADGAHGHFILEGELRQTQGGSPYRLQAAVAVKLEGEGDPRRLTVELTKERQPFRFELDSRPTELRVDPELDLFRRLVPGETPSSLARLFAAESVAAVLPKDERPERLDAYRQVIDRWSEAQQGVEVREDEDGMPSLDAIWLFGRSNRLADKLFKTNPNIDIGEDGITLAGQHIPWEGNSVLLTTESNGQAIAWLVADPPGALAGLARKLPHYGKFSYLVFSGATPEIKLKGQWPVSGRALGWIDGAVQKSGPP